MCAMLLSSGYYVGISPHLALVFASRVARSACRADVAVPCGRG
jgi:hypothetical protein